MLYNYDGTTTDDTCDAFEDEKGNGLEGVLFDAYDETLSRSIDDSGQKATAQERERLVSRLEKEYTALFQQMEVQHGLGFVWACVSSNRDDKFQTLVQTENVKKAFTAKTLSSYDMPTIVSELGCALKADELEAPKEEIKNKSTASLQAESTASSSQAEKRLTVAERTDIVKERLFASYSDALTKVSTIFSKPPSLPKRDVQCVEKILNKQGVTPSHPPNIQRSELARPTIHGHLDTPMAALKKG
ncbi:hypothetical protein IAR50_001625 [Cryptococcus sp. DSM 104548]